VVKQVLFVQGGGEGAHEADAKLAASLRLELGPDYSVHFPPMPNEASPEYEAWKERISKAWEAMGDETFLIGHSLGASMLIKIVTESESTHLAAGVFLISAPFCGDRGWAWEETKLPSDAGKHLSLPLFLYHSRDDEVVPYSHLDLYLEKFPKAQARRLSGRNHQLDDDLSEVAADIRSLD